MSVNKLSYNGSMGQAVAAPVPQLPVRKGSKHGLVEHCTHTHSYSDYVMSKCSANAVTGRCCHSC